jgi:starvation-inducible outer membrane lipoprotein
MYTLTDSSQTTLNRKETLNAQADGKVEAAQWELPCVWINAKPDKHEEKNSRIIEDAAGFAQKRGYITWYGSVKFETAQCV